MLWSSVWVLFFLQYFCDLTGGRNPLNNGGYMKHNVLIWGYLSSLILLLGAIFMNLDFVAGKVLFLVGFFTFNLGYLIPLFIVIFKEHQENRIGLIIVLSILGFFIFLMGVTFFMVSWGGNKVLIYVGGSFLLLASLLMLAMRRRFYETSVDSWFPIVLFSVFIVIGMLTSLVHRPILRSFTISNQEALLQLESLQSRNSHVFDEIESLCADDTALMQIRNKATLVTQKSDSMISYIDNLKRDLIIYVEGNKMLQDTALFVNLVPIQSNVEINSVRRFMLGRKRMKAKLLHDMIDNYRSDISALISPNDAWITDLVNTNLNTNVLRLNKRRYNRDWERQHFYNFPLVTVVSQLTTFQLNVCMVQGELLNSCYRDVLLQRINNLSETEEN